MTVIVDICERDDEPAVMTEVETDYAHIGEAFDTGFRKLVAYMEQAGVEPSGPGFAVYHKVSARAPWRATLGFPVRDGGAGAGDIHVGSLKGGKVAVTVHEGTYEGLAETWNAFEEWLRSHHVVTAGPPWESYVVDDSTEPEPANWRTEIVWPVR